jgi:hypothetical protein
MNAWVFWDCFEGFIAFGVCQFWTFDWYIVNVRNCDMQYLGLQDEGYVVMEYWNQIYSTVMS